MALVQGKQVLRVSFMQKVSRFISPPQPTGSSSCLWKTDSLSKQRRNVLLSRVVEYRTSLFSSTQVMEAGNSSVQEHVEPKQDSSGTSSVTDADVLDRNYGEQQKDHHKVAEQSHDQFKDTQDDDNPESLENTAFDMSKASRPSGDE